MIPHPLPAYFLVFLLCIIFEERRRRRLRLRSLMPPGPPLSWGGLGDNRHSVPMIEPWKTYTQWHQHYGPVVSVMLNDKPTIVLGTLKAANDLLDKRGSIYSSRPRNIIGGEILSGNMRGLGMPYGQRWRNWRSLIHAGLSIEISKSYKVLQSLESKLLLKDLMHERNPNIYHLHVRRFALSVVTNIGYGKRVKTLQDSVVLDNIEIDKYFVQAITPGQHAVESWPILLYLPKCLQWFRWTPEVMRARDTGVYMKLLNEVRERVKNGTARPSVALRALEHQAEWRLNDVELAYAASAPWQAGGNSTTSLYEIFIMAMLLNPEVMRKAQAELDAVVGRNRVPDFEDLDDLPYTHAVIQETYRWCPPLPMVVAHSNICDDEYEGMFIPKNSTIYANVYAMTRDPEMFPGPEEFKPERFLGPNALPVFTATFGFGRRQCPGMHIAINSLFILISRLLWAFDITPFIDPKNGQPVLPDRNDMQGQLILVPKDLKYVLRLREDGDKGGAAVITAEAETAEAELVGWV